MLAGMNAVCTLGLDLVAEPDPAAAAFHAERHARFRQIVSVLRSTGGRAEEGPAEEGPA
jgi:signal recognition particle GTPase